MNRTELEFEPPPLAEWLWVAVAVLILVELVRYVLLGRRPAGQAFRALLAAGCLVAGIGLAMSGRLGGDGSGHGRACVALAVLMTGWLTRLYRQTSRALRPGTRYALLGLRLAAAGIVLAALTGPVLTRSETTFEKPVLGIAVDDSLSMSIRDVLAADESDPAKAISRSASVRAALDAALPALQEIKQQVDVQWFTFDTAVRPTVWPALSGRGEWTALADAVTSVHEVLAQSHRRVAGVLVISDGQDNASSTNQPQEASARLAMAGTPLLAIGVGSELPVGETRNLLARRLIAPERVGVLNRLAVQAELLAAGLGGAEVEVRMLLDGEVVDTERLRPQRAQQLLQVDLACVPAEGGLRLVTVRAQVIGDERPPAELSQFVHVTADQTMVLYVDRPRYERAAIARSLAAARELQVLHVEPSQLTNLLATRIVATPAGQRPRYDAILIGDVEPESFGPGNLARIADLVVAGGSGLAVLGGARSLGPDGFGRTPLAEILPATLPGGGEVGGPLRYQPTPAGQIHPICRLAAGQEDSEALWRRLPELTGTLATGDARPAAEVLAASERGDPLLVVSQSGKGRTAIVAFDSTWRWSFAQEHGGEAHRRFWRQLVLWMANRRPEVWVATDRPRYDLGRLQARRDEVVVRAGVVDLTANEATPSPTVTVTLTSPGKEPVPVAMTPRDGLLEARLMPTAIGEYRLEAQVYEGENIIGRTQTAFRVASTNPELAEPLANLDRLKRMADQTRHIGGLYAPLPELPDVLRQIGSASRPITLTQTRRWHLVEDSPWPWLAAFAMVLTLEWLLRRRAGLV